MTQNEFIDFFGECAACFPGWSKWVQENSPDLQKTLARWASVLSDLRQDECMSVLNRWLHGTIPAPKAYEYENFMLHIKSVVQMDRSKENSRYDSEQNRARQEKSKYKRKPVMAKIGKAFLAMCLEREKVNSGLQTQEQANVAVAEIQADFERQLDLA
jgi:hypothetical protein